MHITLIVFQQYVTQLRSRVVPYFGRLQLWTLMTYTPNLMFWGASSFIGIFVFVEGWPLFRTTLFEKIPYFGQHWHKEIPPEDRTN